MAAQTYIHPIASRRAGFTLTEMLIALGIMGIGMTMVSALFPTAIKQESLTIHDTIGVQIANNGVAVFKAANKHPLCLSGNGAFLLGEACKAPSGWGGGITDLNGTPKKWQQNQWAGFYVFVNTGGNSVSFGRIAGNGPDSLTFTGAAPAAPSAQYGFHIIGYHDYEDYCYPAGNAGSYYGSIVLARPLRAVDPLPNTYQFVSISYRKLDPANCVALVPLEVATYANNFGGSDTITVLDRDGANLTPGTPVIDLETGRYSFVSQILASNGTQAKLTHPLSEAEGTGTLAGGTLTDIPGVSVLRQWPVGQWVTGMGYRAAFSGGDPQGYAITSIGGSSFAVSSPPANGQYAYRIFHWPRYVAVVREYDGNNNPLSVRSPAINVQVSQGAARQ